MAIERLIRNSIAIAAVAMSAPFIAPDLLRYTVMWEGPSGLVDDQPAKPQPAVAKPSPPSAASTSSSLSDGPRGGSVTLRPDATGGFSANPIINGHAVRAVIDTGASTVAIPAETARRLGVNPARGDYDVMISTANGVTNGAEVTIREIKIGDIVVRNVPAVVIGGYGLDTTLLGMSFLRRLQKWEFSGGKLVLTQ